MIMANHSRGDLTKARTVMLIYRYCTPINTIKIAKKNYKCNAFYDLHISSCVALKSLNQKDSSFQEQDYHKPTCSELLT